MGRIIEYANHSSRDMQTYAAADLSEAALGGPIHIEDGHFLDGFGRTLMLRGWNVSGASKLPTEPNGLSHLTEGFYEHRTVTFVGRPFPLEEAPLHFRRLQAWGMPFIRLLVTWESIGHAGPNPNTDLDLEYIAYLRKLVELMPQYGIKCFVCAHQDVWSRFSGGSGAPGWTFEAAGLDIEAFTETGAAYVHGQDELRRAQAAANEKEPSGPFVWPSGYQKLAASTMATLFWAGDALAPKLRCRRSAPNGTGKPEDVSIQTFLQDAFIEAFGRLADEIGHLEACIGFEPMNEPHRGLVNLHGFDGWNYDTDLHIGYHPSLAQALALGSGYAQTVPYYVKSWPWPTRISHRTVLDPKGRSAWLGDTSLADVDRPKGLGKCVWRFHGVWDWDEQKGSPVALQSDYFERDHRPDHEGKEIEWYRDCYAPFLEHFSERVGRKVSRQFSFVEPIPNEFMPPWPSQSDNKGLGARRKQNYAIPTVLPPKNRPRNLVYAPHLYDLNVLFNKLHSWMSVNVQGLARGVFVLKALYFGAGGLRKNYRKQIENIVKYGRLSLGRIPIVIGEIGIPYDINSGYAFLTGDYDKQRELIGALISAMEDNLVDGFSLWNYNPDNRVEYGDGWNHEDFSVVNGNETKVDDGQGHVVEIRPDYRNNAHETNELYRGGRALDAIIRPYAVKIAGVPIASSWDNSRLRYELQWRSQVQKKTKSGDNRSITTEIYIPSYHYRGHQVHVNATTGLDWAYIADNQTLYVVQKGGTMYHKVVVEIRDLKLHVTRRVQQRRRAFPSKTTHALIPAALEIWYSSTDSLAELLAVVSVTVAVFATLLFIWITS
ncbi:putative Glycoside hydrolase superfamily [Seiridium cardinale]|uniref:Glycoside hydrolase superfamily n=1 Tax=Seiridium cardinale TaxID=138064 RepID=A0ABR2Y927_9PEZI